jgi:cupin 2 domain-containing protein
MPPGDGEPTDGLRTGRLAGRAPAAGEDFHQIARLGGARVEHIVSSASADASEQVQAWDEWVVVLSGSAELVVGSETLPLAAGDWVLIPAGAVHRVTRCEAGTQWLAVHGGGPVE